MGHRLARINKLLKTTHTMRLLSPQDLAQTSCTTPITFVDSSSNENMQPAALGQLHYAGLDWLVNISFSSGKSGSIVWIRRIQLTEDPNDHSERRDIPLTLPIDFLGGMGCLHIAQEDLPDNLQTEQQRGSLAMRLQAEGSPLERAVWQALGHIPLGACCSYSAIAAFIGRPKAVRAVGSAIGRNPLAPIVPCHRVLRSDGSMGGYYYGLEIKQKLLDFETNNLLP